MARQRPLPVLAAAPGATAAAASRRQCGTNEHGEKWLRMPRVVNFWEFFFFAAVNSRFSSNFYSLLGMDDEQTGFILGVRPLVGILSVPFWSWFADYRQDVRLTIRITAVISAVIFLSFSLVQLGVIPESWAFSYYLVTRCIFSLFFPPLWTLVDALSLGFFPPARQNEYGGERLWGAVGWSVGHMIIGILMDKFGASIFYVLDAIAVVLFVASMRLMPTQHVAPVVSARRTKRARATARQGESVKLLLVTEGVDGPAKNEENGTAFVTGGLIKSSGSGKKSGKTKKAATTAAQHAITPKQRPAGSDSTLSSKSSKKLQESRRTLPVPATAVLMGQFSWSEYIRQVRQVLCHDLASVVFFFDVFFFGAAFAFVEMLVFLFFVDELGASFALCGASVAVTVSFEIPIFYFSPWILARVSKKTLFVIAHLSYAVRVVGYTLVPNVSFFGLKVLCACVRACVRVCVLSVERELSAGSKAGNAWDPVVSLKNRIALVVGRGRPATR